MRMFALLLLVANLLLAAWLWSRPGPPPPPPAPALGASPLVLLEEMPASPAAVRPSPEVPVETAAAPDPGGCQALGPFMDRDEVIAVRDRLVAAGVAALPRAADASELLGYWVHTPPGSAADATAIVERLRRAGVRDYYVVADSELQNAVSLGVFSRVETAEQHAARMRAMGFEVNLSERRRESTAWWLDFPMPAAGSAAAHAVVELVLESETALLLEPRACE